MPRTRWLTIAVTTVAVLVLLVLALKLSDIGDRPPPGPSRPGTGDPATPPAGGGHVPPAGVHGG